MPASSPRISDYRRALLPTIAPVDQDACLDALVGGGAPFLDLLLSQDLGPLWHHTLQAGNLLESIPAELAETLRASRLSAVAGYMAQRAALGQIDALFEMENIRYVVMKGAHVRECVYPEPSLRASSDIDVLVAASDKQRAAKVLVDAGYALHIEPATISHEATFSRQPIDIDLHWDILRPGRTRLDMVEGFLSRRQWVDGFWGLSDADALFLMLTHPAFAKYVCSPNMGLARVADFLLWTQHKPVDWPAVLRLLDQAGLKTAAWSMLSWFRMLAAPQTQERMTPWLESLQPGHLRSAYLSFWIEHDLPSRWLDHPLPIQLGFTLFLHDRMADASHAIKGLWVARRNSKKDAGFLLDNEAVINHHPG